jgi:hypothetical protein
MIVTCRDLTELVTDKREGKLGRMQRAGCALHLLWCSRCRNYVRQMNLTIEALKHLPPARVPDDTRAALLARFRAVSRHSGR